MNGWSPSWSYTQRPLARRMPRFFVADHHQTITIQNNLEGDSVRLLLSNAGNPAPLEFEGITVSAPGAGAERAVTLHGGRRVRLEADEERYSDELPLAARAGAPFVITTHLRGPAAVVDAVRHYAPAHCRVERRGRLRWPRLGGAYLQTLFGPAGCVWLYGLRAVEVRTKKAPKTIAVFGDSITQMSFWTGPLAHRLYERVPGGVTLLNCGIGGNRLLRDSSRLGRMEGLFGGAGVGRFEGAVYAQGDVDAVLILEGVNDLCHPTELHRPAELPTAADLTAGLGKLAGIAHSHGTRAFGCTILPYGGCPAWTPAAESIRLEVNDWLLGSGVFDGVFDLAGLVRDEQDPARMDPRCDWGDGLHPGAAGGAQMALGMDIDRLP